MANIENLFNRKVAALTLTGAMVAAGCGIGTQPAKSEAAPSLTPSTSPSGEKIDYDKLAQTIIEATKGGTPSFAPSAKVEANKPAEQLPAWPKSAMEAAMVFGTDAESQNPARWEPSAEGGWHFREEAFVSAIDPKGYVLEGYFDTKPGKNPDCFVSNGITVGVQGATIWPVSGTEEATILLNKMALPKWDGVIHPCRPVGFIPTK